MNCGHCGASEENLYSEEDMKYCIKYIKCIKCGWVDYGNVTRVLRIKFGNSTNRQYKITCLVCEQEFTTNSEQNIPICKEPSCRKLYNSWLRRWKKWNKEKE